MVCHRAAAVAPFTEGRTAVGKVAEDLLRAWSRTGMKQRAPRGDDVVVAVPCFAMNDPRSRGGGTVVYGHER